jgi:hypothetical protein
MLLLNWPGFISALVRHASLVLYNIPFKVMYLLLLELRVAVNLRLPEEVRVAFVHVKNVEGSQTDPMEPPYEIGILRTPDREIPAAIRTSTINTTTPINFGDLEPVLTCSDC